MGVTVLAKRFETQTAPAPVATSCTPRATGTTLPTALPPGSIRLTLWETPDRRKPDRLPTQTAPSPTATANGWPAAIGIDGPGAAPVASGRRVTLRVRWLVTQIAPKPPATLVVPSGGRVRLAAAGWSGCPRA